MVPKKEIISQEIKTVLSKIISSKNFHEIIVNLQKKLGGFVTGIIFCAICFFIIYKAIPSQFPSVRLLQQLEKDTNGVEFKTFTVDIRPDMEKSIITWGGNTDAMEACSGPDKPVGLPFVRIYKKSDLSLFSLLPFFRQDYGLFSEIKFANSIDFIRKSSQFIDLKHYDNFLTTLDNVEVIDLDNDGSDEIVVKVGYFGCGSWYRQLMLVFRQTSTGLKYISSLPDLNKDDLALLNTNNSYTYGSEEIIFTTSNDSIIKSYSGNEETVLQFVNHSGNNYLAIGYPIWDSNTDVSNIDTFECHACPHSWYVGVYEFDGKSFIPNYEWNGGRLYKINQKYDSYELSGGIGKESSIFSNIINSKFTK